MKRLLMLMALLVVASSVVASPIPVPDESAWKLPRPPYPNVARMKHEQGRVKLKLTTDATGKVVKVVASVPAQQDDVPDLARICVRWALAYWWGPPNSTRQYEAEFFLR